MKRGATDCRGFALVMVLTLLAVLVLVTYAISLIGRVDTQVGTTTVYQIQARQRALLGLRVGLAELQVAAGPNNRSTGMAGVAGVAAADARRHIAGAWGAAINPIWLVSGNTGGAVPNLIGDRVVLVGPGAVGSPADRTDQELVEAGLVDLQSVGINGHYAYWVGDEGVKISARVPDAEAQVATNSRQPLRLDAKRVLSTNFDNNSNNLVKLVSFESLSYSRTSSSALSLTGAFHATSVRHRALPSSAVDGVAQVSGFVEGGFNINTTSVPVWRGLLEYPDRNTPALGLNATSTLSNARKITDLIAARGAPFNSPAELISSGLLQAAFDATPNRITTITAQEFVDDVAPILTTRSDTFKIRAYGDAMNPADAGVVGASPEAVAYCEAIVQRTPEVIDSLNGPLGRRFVITYFRWLGPDDI